MYPGKAFRLILVALTSLSVLVVCPSAAFPFAATFNGNACSLLTPLQIGIVVGDAGNPKNYTCGKATTAPVAFKSLASLGSLSAVISEGTAGDVSTGGNQGYFFIFVAKYSSLQGPQLIEAVVAHSHGELAPVAYVTSPVSNKNTSGPVGSWAYDRLQTNLQAKDRKKTIDIGTIVFGSGPYVVYMMAASPAGRKVPLGILIQEARIVVKKL